MIKVPLNLSPSKSLEISKYAVNNEVASSVLFLCRDAYNMILHEIDGSLEVISESLMSASN